MTRPRLVLMCPGCRRRGVGEVVASALCFGGTVRTRRRECHFCGRRWTTHERRREPCPHTRVGVLVKMTPICRDCEHVLGPDALAGVRA